MLRPASCYSLILVFTPTLDYYSSMLTIPSVPKGFGPWSFKPQGSAPKMIKDIIEEVCKIVLVHSKVRKSEVYIDIYLKTKEEMAQLHTKLMKKDGPTDTITLPVDNVTLKNPEPTLLGTMFLCWPVIKDDASFLKRDEMTHLAHIVVHSMLHLLGYEHETEQQTQSMEAREIFILSKLGVPSPY